MVRAQTLRWFAWGLVLLATTALVGLTRKLKSEPGLHWGARRSGHVLLLLRLCRLPDDVRARRPPSIVSW